MASSVSSSMTSGEHATTGYGSPSRVRPAASRRRRGGFGCGREAALWPSKGRIALRPCTCPRSCRASRIFDEKSRYGSKPSEPETSCRNDPSIETMSSTCSPMRRARRRRASESPCSSALSACCEPSSATRMLLIMARALRWPACSPRPARGQGPPRLERREPVPSASPSVEPALEASPSYGEGRQHQQVERRRGDQSPEAHDRHRPLDLATRLPAADREGQEAERRHACGHQNRHDALAGAAERCLGSPHLALVAHEVAEVGHHHERVAGG